MSVIKLIGSNPNQVSRNRDLGNIAFVDIENLPIPSLDAATLPLAGTEEVAVVQSGVTKKVSVDDFTAGRQVTAQTIKLARTDTFPGFSTLGANQFVSFEVNSQSVASQFYISQSASTGSLEVNGASNVKLGFGNLIISTAGKGIDFSADGQAAGMTSELLDDYEEGTWTAELVPLISGTITLSAATCTYTKVGRLVTVNGQINTSAISSPTGRLRLRTLPFGVASGTSFESVATIRVIGAVSVIAIDAVVANAGNFIDIYPVGTSTDTYASNIDASTSVVFSAKYFV
jgi:hypothetical protein